MEIEIDDLGLLHRREEENELVDVDIDGFMDIEGEKEGHNNLPLSPELSEDDDTEAVS